MSKGWDSATLKKLKALTGKGLSTAEIGKRLGMSKNAIVGKLNRLGWNPKATGESVPATKSTSAKVSAKTPAPAKKTTATKPAAKITPVKKPAKAPAVAVAKKSAKPEPRVKEVVSKVSAKDNAKTAAKSSSVSSSKNLAMHQRIIQHSLSMASLKPNQCRWPQGDPDSENFHFCGAPVFIGKPYCYEHCKQAFQFNPPKKK